MLIDIFKNQTFWSNLKLKNKFILEVSSKYYKYNTAENQAYDLENNVISRWFNPEFIKVSPSARTYPELAKEQLDEKYGLVLYISNYLPLFLISVLGFDKEILIEDLGAGVGHLLVYLKANGYNNFNVIENFCQTSENCLEKMMQEFDIKYLINKKLNPVILNNSGLPPEVYPFNSYEFERYNLVNLFTYYSNPRLDKIFKEELPKKGFKFLCRDQDDFSVAYCKEEKYKEYVEKLKEFKI